MKSFNSWLSEYFKTTLFGMSISGWSHDGYYPDTTPVLLGYLYFLHFPGELLYIFLSMWYIQIKKVLDHPITGLQEKNTSAKPADMLR